VLKQKAAVFFFSLLFGQSLYADNLGGVKSGFLDLNIYPHLSDVSNDSVVTLNAGAVFGNRLSYFGFINMFNKAGRSELSDLDRFYTEQNLRWKLATDSSVDATIQYTQQSGSNNDKLRIGVRWRLHDSDYFRATFNDINFKWSVNVHALQFDHDPKHAWQIEHVYGATFPSISDRLYLSGFIDHNINGTVGPNVPHHFIISETQLGFRAFDDVYLTIEYRINQARRSDVNNVALGVQYKIKF